MRRLRYTLGSPFARLVRVVLDEKNLDYQRVEEIATSSAEERLKDGPTLQVPAFSDGDVNLWDSSVIVDYLMQTYPNAPAPSGHAPLAESVVRPSGELADKLAYATLNTLAESLVLVAQLRFAGLNAEDNMFVTRNVIRAGHILDWAEENLLSETEGFFPNVVAVQDVFLAILVMFIDKRPIDVEWRTGARPKIAALHDRLAGRPSFAANPIWWFDKGVTGYTTDGTPIYGDTTV